MDQKSYPNKGNTIIGNDVWIGCNVKIMPGITIGDGAIIAANSTVTRNIDPYTIVGGNPAKEIKKRFPENTTQKPLQIKWWDWDIEKITRNITKLTHNDIENLENCQ